MLQYTGPPTTMLDMNCFGTKSGSYKQLSNLSTISRDCSRSKAQCFVLGLSFLGPCDCTDNRKCKLDSHQICHMPYHFCHVFCFDMVKMTARTFWHHTGCFLQKDLTGQRNDQPESIRKHGSAYARVDKIYRKCFFFFFTPDWNFLVLRGSIGAILLRHCQAQNYAARWIFFCFCFLHTD